METVTIDISGWSQRWKNYIRACSVALLYNSGITHGGVQNNGGVINVLSPSSAINGVLTQAAMESWLTNRDALRESQAAEDAIRYAEEKLEAQNSELKEITLAQIDQRIDNLQNVADLKEFLKKLCRYLVARKVLK